MHQGRIYPYLFEYWSGVSPRWPLYAPRKIVVESQIATGDSWDQVAAPVITGVGVHQYATIGDARWSAVLPTTGSVLEVYLTPNPNPGHVDEVSVRLTTIGGATGIVSANFGDGIILGWMGDVISPVTRADPPDFNGNDPLLQIRSALWSEV